MDKLREKTDQKLQKIEKKIQDNPRKTLLTLLTLTILTITTTALLTLPAADNIIQKKNLSKDLVLHYNFESDNTEKVIDRSGNNYTGVIHGDPQYIDIGNGNGALRFDGRGDYVSIDLNETKAPLSIYLKYKPLKDQTKYSYIAGYDNCAWLFHTRKPTVVWRNDYSALDSKQQVSISSEREWASIYSSNNGDIQQLYLNGRKKSLSWQGNISNSCDEFTISKRGAGVFSELKIYESSLSEKQASRQTSEVYFPKRYRFLSVLTLIFILGVLSYLEVSRKHD